MSDTLRRCNFIYTDKVPCRRAISAQLDAIGSNTCSLHTPTPRTYSESEVREMVKSARLGEAGWWHKRACERVQDKDGFWQCFGCERIADIRSGKEDL